MARDLDGTPGASSKSGDADIFGAEAERASEGVGGASQVAAERELPRISRVLGASGSCTSSRCGRTAALTTRNDVLSLFTLVMCEQRLVG